MHQNILNLVQGIYAECKSTYDNNGPNEQATRDHACHNAPVQSYMARLNINHVCLVGGCLEQCYKSSCNALPPGLERRSVAARSPLGPSVVSQSIPSATQSPLANWHRLLILAFPSSSPVPVGALASYSLCPLFDMLSPRMLVSFLLYVSLFGLSRLSQCDHRSDSLLLVTV
jgi:hypothetical protein